MTVVARQGSLCHYLADDSANALWPDQRFPMETCISGWAMLNAAPAVVPDIYEDARIPHEVYRPTFVRSLVMTPIGEGRAFAAFGAYWDRVRQPSQGDIEILEALGSCAAAAFERIWLSQQLRSREDEPVPLAGADGQTDLLDAILRRDAEALLRAREAQLAEALRRLNAIVNNATVAILLMDEHQQCAYMNAAAEKLTGYTLVETLGRRLHEVIHHTRPDGTHYPVEECPIDRAFPEREKMQGEEVFVHKDGSFYPVSFTASPILDDTSRTIGTIIEVQDIRDRRAQEAQKELLMREVDHRARNVLAVVQGIVRLTREDDAKVFKDVVAHRIDSLARAQHTLAETSWQGANLRQIVEDEIAAFAPASRAHLQDKDIFLRADQVQPLCMIVHELTTNAVKYGSLSVPEGQVRIGWETKGSDLSLFCWRESGGPRVNQPTRSGFGTRLIRQLARQLGADVLEEWPPEGLRLTLRLRAEPSD
ncbi:MAG TPA: HWE histidine kinase domain-containing protein [Phenylobacterium sp.]